MTKPLQILLPGIAWLLLLTILLCIPGSAIPKEDWLSKIGFDKWVHFILFLILVVLWCRPLLRKKRYRVILVTTVSAILYGVAMEYVQLYLIPHRSFDAGDIAADAAGAIAGGIFSWGRYIKK